LSFLWIAYNCAGAAKDAVPLLPDSASALALDKEFCWFKIFIQQQNTVKILDVQRLFIKAESTLKLLSRLLLLFVLPVFRRNDIHYLCL
jgi:hypothetical protein